MCVCVCEREGGVHRLWYHMGWARVSNPLLVSACLRIACMHPVHVPCTKIRKGMIMIVFVRICCLKGGITIFCPFWVFVGGHDCFQLIKLEMGGPGSFDPCVEKMGGPKKILGKK